MGEWWRLVGNFTEKVAINQLSYYCVALEEGDNARLNLSQLIKCIEERSNVNTLSVLMHLSMSS